MKYFVNKGTHNLILDSLFCSTHIISMLYFNEFNLQEFHLLMTKILLRIYCKFCYFLKLQNCYFQISWLYAIYFYCYSKTPIYHRVWGKGNIRGKLWSAVNQGFVWFTLCMFSPIWGEGNGRSISGFAVNRGAVYQGFTVYVNAVMYYIKMVVYKLQIFLNS